MVETTIKEMCELHGIDAEGLREAGRAHGSDVNKDEVMTCLVWLSRNARPLKRIRHWHTSYGLKHVVETEEKRYVSNGAFIVAALLAGFRHKPSSKVGGPNACFNLSLSSKRSANGTLDTNRR